MDPNFLLVHRNRYLKGMGDGQMTPRGNPNLNSYIKNLYFLVFQTEGRTDGQTDRENNPGGLGNYVPPGKFYMIYIGTRF
jgi:hypothetical protein